MNRLARNKVAVSLEESAGRTHRRPRVEPRRGPLLELDERSRTRSIEAQVTRPAERLPSTVVCACDVTSLPGPMLLKGGWDDHPLAFGHDYRRHNEHHVPSNRFLEEL
jgi:hypothetical protein